MNSLDDLQNAEQEAPQQTEASTINHSHDQSNITSSGSNNTNANLSEVEVGRDINIYTTEIVPQEVEVFKDPTEVFTLQKDMTPLYMNEEVLQKSLTEIDRERIIFLGGKSENNVVAVLHNLIKNYQPASSWQYRWLSFWGKNNAQRNIYLHSINEEAFPQNAIVAIDITQNKASDTFLKSIVEMSEQGAIEIKNTLRKKNLVIICYFQGVGHIQQLTNQNQGTFGFHYWDTSPPINTLKEFIAEFKYDKLEDKNYSVFKYILYVATFFPRTSPKEFKKIVDVLLSEKQDEILADTTREMGEKDEIIRRTEELTIRNLLDLWDHKTDDFFKKCNLIIIQENELQKVDFEDTRIREAYQGYFRNQLPFFLLEQFDNLLQSGLPFTPDTSAQVMEYFIQLACELARNDPYFYGTKLLETLSRLFKNPSDEKTNPATLQTFLIELIYAMLKLENVLLTENIESFLIEHLDHRYKINKTSHYLLANIIFELRDVEMFDTYHWIKMMIREGKKETRGSAYRLLFRLADSYKENLTDIHTEFFDKVLKPWLSEVESITLWNLADNQNLLDSYVLSFIIDYWGFYNLDSSNILAESNPEFLVSWLFHPSLEIGYYNRSRQGSLREIKYNGSKQGQALSVDPPNVLRVLDRTRAMLTEIWFKKVLSLNETPTPTSEITEDIPTASQQYVELFYKYADARQREALTQEWALQIHRYWQQSNDLEQYAEEERNHKKEEFMLERRNLMRLKREFSKLLEYTPARPSIPYIKPNDSNKSNTGCFPFAGQFQKIDSYVKKIKSFLK